MISRLISSTSSLQASRGNNRRVMGTATDLIACLFLAIIQMAPTLELKSTKRDTNAFVFEPILSSSLSPPTISPERTAISSLRSLRSSAMSCLNLPHQLSPFSMNTQIQLNNQAMTSQVIDPEALFDCPICLSALVLPITLTCGHTFCETCIKSKYFSLVKQACPLCRKPLICDLDMHSVSVVLQQILNERYGCQKVYQERVLVARRAIETEKASGWRRVKKWVKGKAAWIIIAILVYHLLKVKVNFFSFKFKDYKDKAMSIANSIKVENSLDFKFLLFSQFMRLLFSTIVIP